MDKVSDIQVGGSRVATVISGAKFYSGYRKMSLSDTALHKAANFIQKGRTRPLVSIGHLPEDCRPQNADDAMAIQDVVHQRLTAAGYGQLVGTKIGCTTQVMQEYLGIDQPCVGGIFDRSTRHGEGSFDFDDFLHVGVECEIAATIGSVIRAADAPHSLDRVSQAVMAVHAAIEIVDDRYVDFTARVPDWRTWLADDFFGAGIVLGEPVADWEMLDLPSVQGTMRINEVEVGTGYGRDIINGHPLEALVWLANHESQRGRDIPADWIVMLGSVVQTNWLVRGDVVDVEIGGLGHAVARFDGGEKGDPGK